MGVNIREILIDGLDYIKRVNKNLHLIIDAISSSNIKEIDKNYGDLKEGLEWLQDILAHISVLTDIDYSNMTINRQNCEIIIKQYSDYINILDIIYSQNNYDELATSIENELPKFLRKLSSILNKVYKIL